MQHEFWDTQKFEDTWNNVVERVLEKKLEDIQDNLEDYDEKYLEVLDKVSQLGGVNTWIKTKDKKYEIRIDNIEPETSLITYIIKEPYKWQTKAGKTDIDGLISIIYNEKLFNMMEHLDKFSILRNKTFL
jgi:transcriptional/translational regulatory protein YebC/TACO1